MTTTQHEAFTNYPDQVESLIAFVQTNNLDISTPEKFSDVMRDWYKRQRRFDKFVDDMPTNVFIKLLKIEG